MEIRLLGYTPNPEKIVAAAAKLCYSEKDISELMDNLTPENVEKFIDKLEKLGHESPFEHAVFTFGISGISRVTTHQLVRHRIASYSQKSQRYVKEQHFKYVTPESLSNIKVSVRLPENKISTLSYDDVMDILQQWYNGVTVYDDTVPNEDARYILPNACCSSIIVTMNTRALYNFFNLRCCNRAQWEIRDMAKAMLKLCKSVSPQLFKYSGPKCLYDKCPEGTMSCGNPPVDLK